MIPFICKDNKTFVSGKRFVGTIAPTSIVIDVDGYYVAVNREFDVALLSEDHYPYLMFILPYGLDVNTIRWMVRAYADGRVDGFVKRYIPKDNQGPFITMSLVR